MRDFFFLVLVLIFTNCNSKTKSGNEDSGNDTTSTTRRAGDTAVTMEENQADLESFGEIRLGLTHKETIKALGEPDSRSTATVWGADGKMHEDWTYTGKGIELNMSSDKGNADNGKSIFSISANAPCTFKTKKNMGIGSSYNEVYQAYEKDIDKSASDKAQIVAGSIYGGIIFTFKNDKVESIFVGAAAE